MEICTRSSLLTIVIERSCLTTAQQILRSLIILCHYMYWKLEEAMD